ncbi:helix-turn-helix domain-containing protein [Sphingobacterium sp. DN00404]|uniref:Helix-turn-helix domain-containing protein n=2 Tax=Sphingobacterium micropteri TaxID=2763501 RepID=A0ABR7YU35_9SPHI|nr:helix-turn-helix domain-containing protein [Sphingobacterium micropteri]
MENEINTIKEWISEIRQNGIKENKDELMTVAEAALFLKVSINTVRKWARESKIPHSKIGTWNYFKKSDLENYNRIEIKKPRGLRF